MIDADPDDFDQSKDDFGQEPETVTDAELSPWELRKAQILAEFKDWLDQLDDEPEDDEGDTPEATGLYQVHAEIAALRQELKVQSRNAKSSADKLESLAAELHGSLQDKPDFDGLISDLKRQVPQARRDAALPVIHELLPLIEGLQRSQETLAKIELPFLLTNTRKEQLRRELREPLAILASKAAESLSRLQIQSLARPGASFDASTMRAVATSSGSGQTAGNISEILRQGYSWRGEVIHTAEVKVEK